MLRASWEMGVREILFNHAVGIEIGSVQRTRMPHYIDPSLPVSGRTRYNDVFQFPVLIFGILRVAWLTFGANQRSCEPFDLASPALQMLPPQVSLWYL
jgi:hypothetical protein